MAIPRHRVQVPHGPTEGRPRPFGPTSPPQSPVAAADRKTRSDAHYRVPHRYSFSHPFTIPEARNDFFHMPPRVSVEGSRYQPQSLRPERFSPESTYGDASDFFSEDEGNINGMGGDAPSDEDDDDDDDDSLSEDDGHPRSVHSDFSDEAQASHSRGREIPVLNPVDSDESGATDDDDDDDDDESSESDDDGPLGPDPAFVVVETTLIVEEITTLESENSTLPVISPSAIEEPIPKRRRRRRESLYQRLRPHSELDPSVVDGFKDLNCHALSDEDDSDLDEAEYTLLRIKRQEQMRHRRMTSGSIGKRTISESIGSDTDTEDMHNTVDPSEVGSSARRLRRRIGDRHSLQFADPPPARIDELDEPETDNEDVDDDDVEDSDSHHDESLTRELPYYSSQHEGSEMGTQ